MVNPGSPRPPRLVAEALGTREIPAKLAAILADHSQTVRKDGAALTAEKRLERLTVVGVDPDRRVHIIHLLFSVQVNLYLTQQRLFACLGDLPVKGLPPVVEIPNKAFVAQRSVHAVPRMDHVTHLGGVSPPDWQTNSCKKEGKTAVAE